MSVDVMPLGRPELGMTRAELIDASYAAMDSFNAETELFYVLLFAYIIGMYIAGSQLTRLQYGIANAMYLLVMANTVLACWLHQYQNLLFLEYAGGEPFKPGLYWTAALRVVLVALSLWFGRKIRHPALE